MEDVHRSDRTAVLLSSGLKIGQLACPKKGLLRHVFGASRNSQSTKNNNQKRIILENSKISITVGVESKWSLKNRKYRALVRALAEEYSIPKQTKRKRTERVSRKIAQEQERIQQSKFPLWWQ
jgi:hypothetical protein